MGLDKIWADILEPFLADHWSALLVGIALIVGWLEVRALRHALVSNKSSIDGLGVAVSGVQAEVGRVGAAAASQFGLIGGALHQLSLTSSATHITLDRLAQPHIEVTFIRFIGDPNRDLATCLENCYLAVNVQNFGQLPVRLIRIYVAVGAPTQLQHLPPMEDVAGSEISEAPALFQNESFEKKERDLVMRGRELVHSIPLILDFQATLRAYGFVRYYGRSGHIEELTFLFKYDVIDKVFRREFIEGATHRYVTGPLATQRLLASEIRIDNLLSLASGPASDLLPQRGVPDVGTG